MSGTWLLVLLCGAGTAALKSAGPVLLGGRPLPAGIARVVGLLGPALLAALVAVTTFGGDRALTLDARALGVGAAAVAIRARAPVLLVVAVAAVVTGLARALA